ncbi:hypothetical protein ACVFI8_08675 [Agarivorans sp. MS3-6]|uniref:hypothetical protein n=1 Tax=Agarivorans sp. TSD2052 TaxID=2937286 RepID=UPI00200C7887|nr:hypothetical protein [Agarivorans sp. TSD2052]UPW18940.1 hypothetical protein M0C34_01295 [Agarivorans sp. TSD2052]
MKKLTILALAATTALASMSASAKQPELEQLQAGAELANSSARCLAAHAYINDKDEREALLQMIANMPDQRINRESIGFMTVLSYALGEASMGLHAVEHDSGKEEARAMAQVVYDNNHCNIEEVLRSVG